MVRAHLEVKDFGWSGEPKHNKNQIDESAKCFVQERVKVSTRMIHLGPSGHFLTNPTLSHFGAFCVESEKTTLEVLIGMHSNCYQARR